MTTTDDYLRYRFAEPSGRSGEVLDFGSDVILRADFVGAESGFPKGAEWLSL